MGKKTILRIIKTVLLTIAIACICNNARAYAATVASVNATSDISSIFKSGNTVKNPSFQVDDSDLYFVNLSWQYKEGTQWKSLNFSSFRNGTYSFELVLRTDNTGKKFDEHTKLIVNGVEWISLYGTEGYLTDSDYVWFRSPDMTISGAATVSLKCTYDVNNGFPISGVGEPIDEIDLSSYTEGEGSISFAKISGPDWINVSTEGIISGTPVSEQASYSNLVVRITDSLTHIDLSIKVKPTVLSQNLSLITGAGNVGSILKFANNAVTPSFVFDDADIYCVNIGWFVKRGTAFEPVSLNSLFQNGTYVIELVIRTRNNAKIIMPTTSLKIDGKEWTNLYYDDGRLNDSHYVWFRSPEMTINHTHHEISVLTKATLTENGKIENKCSECGTVIGETAIIYYPKTIKLSKSNVVYDGKAKNVSVSVIDSNGNVIANNCYDILIPTGRKNPGKYEYSVKFKGNYTGTARLELVISPVKTSLKKLEVKEKSIKVNWNKKSKGVSGYQIQYSTSSSFKNAKNVTVKGNSNVTKTINKLKAGQKYYVRIRTYYSSKGKKVYSAWSAKKSVKIKK